MEDAPKPINNSSINVEIKENNDNAYNLTITNSFSVLKIYVEKENSFPKVDYYKEFKQEELAKTSKFFKVFEDINSVFMALKEIFESKKPILMEENEYINLKIVPIISALGESNLIIPRKKEDDKKIINDLCDVVNKQGKEIENLKGKIKTLEEKIDKLEKTMENNIVVRRLRNTDSLIGDIIKTNEQFNLICDWIDRDKNFKFKLLYKGTTDGDTKEIFHKKCDNQGPTISIIESTDGQIFGGYASKSWDKNSTTDIPDSNSFLFNINIRKKYSVLNNRGLMNGYICDFGGSNFHELWIYNNYFSNKGGCDNGTGYNFKNYELSGGKNYFEVKELEVYKVDEV